MPDKTTTSMKAWVLHTVGDIRFEDVPVPEPAANEVLVKVKACGICGSDVPRVYETGAHRMPLIPGHEFSGVVETCGKEVDPGWQGRRVGVFPLIPCGVCTPCRQGLYELCRDYDYTGSRRDGAFAEYVTVPVHNLIVLPDSVSFAEAAMLEPMAVAVHAMRRGTGTLRNDLKHDNGYGEGALCKDAPVAVCGLGTIGLLIVSFLQDAGYRNLYLIGNKEFQKTTALRMGIIEEHFCDSRTEDAAAWLQRTCGGAALFFECVGRNDSICYAIDGTAPAGRVVTVGNPAGDMTFSRDTYWKILRNQLVVFGTWNSSFFAGDKSMQPDDWHYVLDRMKHGDIKPASLITHRLPIDQLEQGLLIMKEKKEDHCKVMTMME